VWLGLGDGIGRIGIGRNGAEPKVLKKTYKKKYQCQDGGNVVVSINEVALQ